MTGSPQTDPRIEAVAEFLLQQFGSKSGSTVPLAGHRLIARRFLATVDAADEEAAGIRRVTREELDAIRAEERLRISEELVRHALPMTYPIASDYQVRAVPWSAALGVLSGPVVTSEPTGCSVCGRAGHTAVGCGPSAQGTIGSVAHAAASLPPVGELVQITRTDGAVCLGYRHHSEDRNWLTRLTGPPVWLGDVQSWCRVLVVPDTRHATTQPDSPVGGVS